MVTYAQPNLVGSRFAASSPLLWQWRHHLWVSLWTLEPISYRGLPGDRGAFGTDTIPWHCQRLFFTRDTGSHQRVFAIWSSSLDHSLCRQCLLSRSVSPWESGGVEVAISFEYLHAGFIPQVIRNYVMLKKSQIRCHMEYFFTKGHGIIFLCLFRT